jgi:hypothetical protein
MAFTSTKSVSLTYHQAVETDAVATVIANIAGGAATLYSVQIDNDANAGNIVYVRFWDATSATNGTTVPYLSLKADADDKNLTYVIPQGLTFSTGISFACVTDHGGTAGTSAPSGDVIVRLVYN